MHLAAGAGHVRACAALVALGADLAAAARDGATPLHRWVFWRGACCSCFPAQANVSKFIWRGFAAVRLVWLELGSNRAGCVVAKKSAVQHSTAQHACGTSLFSVSCSPYVATAAIGSNCWEQQAETTAHGPCTICCGRYCTASSTPPDPSAGPRCCTASSTPLGSMVHGSIGQRMSVMSRGDVAYIG